MVSLYGTTICAAAVQSALGTPAALHTVTAPLTALAIPTLGRPNITGVALLSSVGVPLPLASGPCAGLAVLSLLSSVAGALLTAPVPEPTAVLLKVPTTGTPAALTGFRLTVKVAVIFPPTPNEPPVESNVLLPLPV